MGKGVVPPKPVWSPGKCEENGNVRLPLLLVATEADRAFTEQGNRCVCGWWVRAKWR